MDVSVVIPTFNRSAMLARALRCLAQQAGPYHFEVLVCDDGSRDATKSVVEAARDALDIRYFYQPDLGFRAGQARNMGIRAARGEYIVLLDDDMLVAPDFLATHVETHRAAAEPALVIGLRHRAPSCDELPRHTADIRCHAPEERAARIGHAGERLADVRPPWLLVHTCNLSAPSAAAELRFDESFSGWGLEDFEFGYRMLRQGLQLCLAADAPALHLDEPSPRDPFLARRRGTDADFASYIRNLLCLLALHGKDPPILAFVQNQLRWLRYDPRTDRWLHGQATDSPFHLAATAQALAAIAYEAAIPTEALALPGLFGFMLRRRMALADKYASRRAV